MTRIICLANSWKRGDRCIAGINEINGNWVRPISDLPDGQIPKEIRQINRLEPALLDVIDIPLANTGPDFGFECENLSIIPGKWQHVGKVSSAYLLKYFRDRAYILHNDLRFVTVDYMQSLPREERITLQLIKAVKFTVRMVGKRFESGNKWEGSIVTAYNQKLTATITDPVFTRRLDLGYRPEKACLLTISLSMPWRPDDWEGDDPCWKLIAGVIELEEDIIYY
ncbi:MAG: hypothetical protein JGK24_16475 [Microcoleus sp. PH2017_29_MFU_D_A]|jgi:hypothetical protein|uniref:dual OB domain-containing protein n=1 Tax=unclassified Microcoleus TaxID=2642155 RepID=UPI001D51BCC3|nr:MULTISPECIES: hypothetical protein [unclassified Microcoleus]MCC3421146.1 hypothetical protein [Microcoleus sp. PH2017_07_MST_O_A]MCC3432691.1 hypothetical protein [Microcoleus sp. PH2017_04_SCI_O_A]MCC3443509.1 hypothetical protein [Microcoleus sp. PH2017_03_ELD_O_A]MCC3469182.1 hypothetical protein [Microcoleus sp. PH2017_06_SFM_O_A]MCC3506387.1 hypothetical protein [Microcoleus sp. PH2017_19_SFW_U_A]MCC3509483.1 hypothetical protein [Microcoleus sp. PH2017_17_BER_D_A]TAE08909.1 MAG: hy